VTTTLCPRTKRTALLQRISPPPGTWRSIAEKWGDRYGRDGGLEQTNTHATCLSAYAAGLPCSPGARSRERSPFLCMAVRPVSARASHPGTLRRSRWRLRPGLLRSIPSCSAVRICCARFCRTGECRAWSAVGSAFAITSECAPHALRCTRYSLALKEHTLTVLERACRCGASGCTPRGERASKHFQPARSLGKVPCSLGKVPASCTSRPCNLAPLHPHAPAIQVAQPRLVCTLRSA